MQINLSIFKSLSLYIIVFEEIFRHFSVAHTVSTRTFSCSLSIAFLKILEDAYKYFTSIFRIQRWHLVYIYNRKLKSRLLCENRTTSQEIQFIGNNLHKVRSNFEYSIQFFIFESNQQLHVLQLIRNHSVLSKK